MRLRNCWVTVMRTAEITGHGVPAVFDGDDFYAPWSDERSGRGGG